MASETPLNTVESIAERVRIASLSARPLTPRGAGTRAHLGGLPPAGAVDLPTTALDCIIEGLDPDPNPHPLLTPTTERQAMNEGLSVRDPDKRSIWAPLMQGEREACGELAGRVSVHGLGFLDRGQFVV